MYPEGKERPKKEVGHSGLVGGSFNKQRELTYKACFGQRQDEWITALALQILEVCKKVLSGLSTVQVFSIPHHHIARLCPWSSLWEQERQMEPTFQGYGRG